MRGGSLLVLESVSIAVLGDRSAYDGLLRLNGGGVGGLKFKRLASYQAAKRFYITKTEWSFKEILAGTAPEPPINCYTWKCWQ